MMKKQYQLVAPIRAVPDGQAGIVTLPAGAMLYESTKPSSTVMGMIGVYWLAQHYSVLPSDLLKNTLHPVVAVRDPRPSCGNCAKLEGQLSMASDHYVKLTTQHEQLDRDDEADTEMHQSLINQARRRRDAVARLFLAHRKKHQAVKNAGNN